MWLTVAYACVALILFNSKWEGKIHWLLRLPVLKMSLQSDTGVSKTVTTHALPCVVVSDQITLGFHTNGIIEQVESRSIDKFLYINWNTLGGFEYVLKIFLSLNMQVMSPTCAKVVTYLILGTVRVFFFLSRLCFNDAKKHLKTIDKCKFVHLFLYLIN